MLDHPDRATAPALGGIRRRTVRLDDAQLVRHEAPPGGGPLPLIVRPAGQSLDLAKWAAPHREHIDDLLSRHGGILFRGFGLIDPDALEQVITAIAGAPLAYHERSSPRTSIAGHIYTSTDHPPDQEIFLHNENSYQGQWPLRIFFCCVQPAERGGETPIADTRKVLARLDAGVVEKFERRGVMYVRNFSAQFGLPWQTVFQTTDASVAEDYCRRAEIACTWTDGELTTRQVRPAIRRHPRTGERVWFNHAAFFHVSTLDQAVQQVLLATVGEDKLPNQTFYGDGSPIEPAVMESLRDAYRQETIAIPWLQGDVLVLDNMLAAHGRRPFTGARRVLVGMAQPTTEFDL